MNKYTINNNNFFIFDKNLDQQKLHFLWGKFDFRIKFQAVEKPEQAQYQDDAGNFFAMDYLEGLLKKEWHRFERVTGHGFTFGRNLLES